MQIRSPFAQGWQSPQVRRQPPRRPVRPASLLHLPAAAAAAQRAAPSRSSQHAARSATACSAAPYGLEWIHLVAVYLVPCGRFQARFDSNVRVIVLASCES